MARVALFLAIAIAIFGIFNFIAVRALLRIHPRRNRLITALAVAGNLMWPFFPLLRALTPFSRATRALFGPPWFTWTCFTILYTTLVAAVAIAWLPFLRRIRFADFARWPSRVFLWTSMVAGVWGFYDAIVPLRVEHVPLYVDNLPAAAGGMRVAVMADLHVGLFTRSSRVHQFFRVTRELHPDVVLLAGDLIDDDPYFVPKLLDATRELDPKTPLLAGVLGNHEMYGDPLRVIEELRGSRIQLLVNRGIAVGPLWFAGLSDFAAQLPQLKPDLGRALDGQPAGTFPIIVAHQPKAFDEARRRRLPLTIVAHTHGGQFGIRPLGWSLAGVFLPYHMGLYRRGESQLYVNTGTGFWLIPFRLGMTPEITLIELRPRPVRRRSSPRS